MDKEIFLSEHIKKYNSVGAEKLNSYVDLFVVNLVAGGILSDDSREFIVDFVQTLSSEFISMKVNLYRELVNNKKLEKEKANLEQRLAESASEKKTVMETNVDVEDNSGDNWELDNIQKVDLNRLVKRPRYFDGVDPLPREWIEEYKDAMEDNRWNEPTAIYYFRHFLTKDASAWFKLNVRPKITKGFSWATLFREFEANYLGRAEEDRIRLLLNRTIMSYEDRVANFIPRVQRMIKILNPEISEKEQVDKISEKLRADYAAAIVEKEPKTVEDLRNICRKVEAAADLRKASSANNRTESNKTNFQMRSSKTNSQPQRGVKSKMAVQERKCFRCNRNNHLVKDCRALTKLDGSTINESRKPIEKKAIGKISNVELTKGDTEEVRILCGAIMTSINDSRKNMMKQYVECNGIGIYAIVDSGAWITVLDEKLAIENNWNVTKTNKQAIGANSQPLIIVGEVKIEVAMIIDEIRKIKEQTCLVVRNLAAPMLLGADMLVSFDIVIDLPNKRLSLASHMGPGLKMINRRIVPARSQLMVQTYSPVSGEILVLSYNFSEDLMIANSVCEATANIAPVMVMNMSKNNIVLERGQRIASYERLSYEPIQPIMALVNIPNSEEFVKIGDHLDESQIKDVKRLIESKAEAFSLNNELGCSGLVKHKIEIESNARPVMEPLRRRPLIQVEETRRQVAEMLEKGIIEESTSPWASAYVVVKKKTGEMRICIDFRKLNAVTKKNAYPLPRIDSCLDVLAGKKYFSNFDFSSGYWQIEMEEESKEFTAFRTEDGHFQFRRMPFGLTNAPASFQRLMNGMLAGVKGLELQVYLDDVCLATNSWAEHLEMLEKFLSLVINNKLKLKPSKCLIGAKEVTFLGHHISERGIGQDPKKLKAIRDMPAPNDVSGVRRVLGLMSYYRKFVPNFAKFAGPLIALTRKNVKFEWTPEHEKAFVALKEQLTLNNIRSHFNPKAETIVKTDASRSGVGGILLQKQEGSLDFGIIECASRRLSAAECNYGITDLEGLAVMYSLQKFRSYLIGIKFKLLVDHCSLCVLKKKLPQSQRLHRWAILLSEFDFEVIYTKGTNHIDVDCLSRAPIAEEEDEFIAEKIFHLPLPMNSEEWNNNFGEEDEEIVKLARENKNDLSIIDDTIYMKSKIYVPKAKRESLLREAHELGMGGHGGQLVTYNKLETCWWPNIKEEVKNFVASCEKCQRRKVERALPYGTMRHFQFFEPFEAWSLDTLGPISETLNGHKFIIVAVDIFSRWLETKAIKDLKAPSCAQFCRELLSRYGPAKQIFTDHGPQYWNNLVGDTLKVFGVKQTFSTADHPQGNSPAERAIQTLTEKLSLNSQSNDWNVALPVTTFAINTSINKSTGYQPYEILFGKKGNCLQSLTTLSSPVDSHIELLKRKVDEVRAEAIINQGRAQSASRSNYRRREKTFNVDDWVWVRSANKRKGKLDDRFMGPYQVVSRNNDIYELKEERSNRTLRRHVESLKPCVRQRSASLTGFIMSMLLIITAVQANFVFDRVDPIRWLPTNKLIFGRNVRVDLTLNIINPCESLRKASTELLSSSAKNSSIETEANRMLTECEKSFNTTWIRTVTETLARCGEVNNENISKKQWSAIAGGMMGGIFGAVTTDLVGTIWDYVNPYSDHNKLKTMENKVGGLEKETSQILDAFKNTTASLVRGLHAISEDLQVHRTDLHELAGATPQFIWAAIRLMSHISMGGSHLVAIQESCDKRQMNTVALSKLMQQSKLRKFDTRDTTLISITGNYKQLRFTFDAVEESIDTRLFAIDSFWLYDNLASKAVKKRYTGPEHVVWNSTSKCALGVEKWPETDRVLYLKCAEASYNDPKLAKWKEEETFDFVTEQKQIVQQKSNSFENLIYCFPGPIEVHNVKTTCPPYPFRLPKSIAFACNNYTYSGQSNLKLSHDSDIKFRMAEVHGDDTPTVFEVELIVENEKLRKISGFVAEIHDTFTQAKSTGFWINAIISVWIVICIIGILYWWRCRRKTRIQPPTTIELNVNPSRPESSNAKTTDEKKTPIII